MQAVETSEVLGIARRAILDRFAEEPEFAARFYRALAIFLSVRLRETTAAAARIEDAGVTETAKVTGDRFRRLFGMRR
ncbi:MAG: cyclic nucleotide-binding protein [Rhizorhabdus sp.]|nr:cyclic nucleotide-binding protein [Rhizorhabdus sp.]